MSSSKADYPSRPPKERPKKPGKGVRTPSRTSGGGRRKTWVSDGSIISGGADMSPRMQAPWYRSAYMQLAKRVRQGLGR